MPTTPKPLLTLVDGAHLGARPRLALAGLGDDRGVRVGRGRGGRFVGPAGRPRRERGSGRGRRGDAGTASARDRSAAAAFATAALLTSSDLLLEVSRANSLVWALAFWSLAGLFIIADAPRPVLGGVDAVPGGPGPVRDAGARCGCADRVPGRVAMAGAAAGGCAAAGPARAAAGRARRRVVIAFLALPVAMLHDWLLSRRPVLLARGARALHGDLQPGPAPIDPLTMPGRSSASSAPEWPLVLLAAVGSRRARAGPRAARPGRHPRAGPRRDRAPVLARRSRHLHLEPLLRADRPGADRRRGGGRRLAGRVRSSAASRRWASPAALAAGAARASLLLWPALPWDRRATTELTDVRTASDRLAAAMPNLDIVIHDLQPPPPAAPRPQPRRRARCRRAAGEPRHASQQLRHPAGRRSGGLRRGRRSSSTTPPPTGRLPSTGRSRSTATASSTASR